jgi:hypothetical protein
VLGCEVQLWVIDGCCRLWQRLPRQGKWPSDQ